ncbi:MAG: lysozyme inhibitor LprI family protein [Allosphingosinicella sp.]
MILTMLAAAALAPASPPDPARRLAAVEAELNAVEAALPGAIDAASEAGLDRPPEDLTQWKAAAASSVSAWVRFGAARCDPRLIAFETGRTAADARAQALACRLRIAETALTDLRLRYGLAGGGPGRRDAEHPAARQAASPEEEGPCADAPPRECDYCGMNRCWAARLKADEARLNAAWRAALARIAARPGLSAVDRKDWSGRLRAAQRRWLEWRDGICELERLETPNPYAHSIYALVTGPCLDAETAARTLVLRQTYGRR